MAEEDIILILVMPLVAASLLGLLVRSVGLSAVAGYIVGGIVVGPLLRIVDPTSPILSFLSELGIILISFEIGLAVKLSFFRRGGSRVFGIVGLEVVIVALITYALGNIFSLRWGDVVILAFMAVNTSTAVTFKMMDERISPDSEIRRLVLGVGALEDVLALIGLTIIPIIAMADTPSPLILSRMIIGILISVVMMIYIGLKVLSRPLRWVARRESDIFLAVSLAVVLIYSYIGVSTGLSAALGAFVAGLVVSNLEISGIVSERLQSIRDLSSLIFFSSIGASLPSIFDPVLIVLALTVSLLVVFLKFFGFSIASWVLGTKMEDSFRLGLYMLAISEFGVILARDAVDSGLASSTLYMVSVIAVAASAILSSSLVAFENVLPIKLLRMFPEVFRLNIERFSSILISAVRKELLALGKIRMAFWELVKRIAIIVVVASSANLIVIYVTPYIPSSLRFYVEASIVVLAATITIVIALRMRELLRMLIMSITERLGDTERRVEGVMIGLLYALTVGALSISIVIISLPQIERVTAFLGGKTSSNLIVLGIIVTIVLLVYRYARSAITSLEKTFQIGT